MTFLVHVDNDIRRGSSDNLGDDVDDDSLTLVVNLLVTTVRLSDSNGSKSSDDETGLHGDDCVVVLLVL